MRQMAERCLAGVHGRFSDYHPSPVASAAPIEGYVDRTAKRPLLFGADLVRAVSIPTIPVTAWAGALSMPELYVVTVAVRAATTLFQIADNSFLPARNGVRLTRR
jgi:hypothetical protein